MMSSLGSVSRKNLIGVHPDLAGVVEDAILDTPVDWRVQEGVRLLTRQKHLVEIGASTTLDSQHLVQTDGFGHAVDLVPWVDFDGDGDKELRWDWPLAYKVAQAVQNAAKKRAVVIRWGGCWDRPLNALGDPETASHDYVRRRLSGKKRAFIDSPHFELWKRA